ncbi:MAG: YraN family protein [Alphaproteobacteria bacterium]|nr:YraN family protein [Alphaproteobacteria bacterium]
MTRVTNRTLRRKLREKRGRRAEDVAALWLRLKGYHILDRRARTPHGEIDLIASRGAILAFVEVKARSRIEVALVAVTPELRRRIEAAARLWVSRRRGLETRNWRFDIVAIAPGRLPRHLRDAWRAEK